MIKEMHDLKQTLLPAELIKLIPGRKEDANKNDFGHVLIVGGDYNLAGSVIMAAEAAFKVGSGKVTVLTRPDHFNALITRLPCAMTTSANSTRELKKIVENKSVVAFGPGLGNSAWSNKMFEFFIHLDLPKVIDADALNLLSNSKTNYHLSQAVLTPHAGEAARLLKSSSKSIQADRLLAVKQLQEKYQTTVVLKGKNSLILDQQQKLFSCPYGNSGMAVAGMGDVLTGIIAGLAAQKLALNHAAVLGVYLHALAGDLAKEKQGEIGILPTELINYLSLVINSKTTQ